MVPQVQASSRRNGFLIILPTPERKKVLLHGNFCGRLGFVAEATRISERRRLCDAKTQLTIPGAQPSSSICE